jgi:hypothetical protein
MNDSYVAPGLAYRLKIQMSNTHNSAKTQINPIDKSNIKYSIYHIVMYRFNPASKHPAMYLQRIGSTGRMASPPYENLFIK